MPLFPLKVCQITRALVPLAIGLSGLVACGGSTQGDDASRDDDATTAGGSGGTTASSSGSSGGSATGGTGGSPVSPCEQPIVAGPCEAAFPRYAYDRATGYCTPFTYGGCQGNDNNFESLRECDDTCRDGDATPVDHCEQATDCGLEFFGCCGPCEPIDMELLQPVNVAFISELQRQAQEACGNVSCGACAPELPVSQNYGVACEDRRCVAYDVRQREELTACGDDSNCRLRNGTGCCEVCDSERDRWIAVSAEASALAEALCGGDFGCPACAPIAPEELSAECVQATCQVVGRTNPAEE